LLIDQQQLEIGSGNCSPAQTRLDVTDDRPKEQGILKGNVPWLGRKLEGRHCWLSVAKSLREESMEEIEIEDQLNFIR